MIRWWSLMLLLSVVLVEAGTDKHRVFRVSPADDFQSAALHMLYEGGEFDFWKEPSVQNASAEVLVHPAQDAHFQLFLNETRMPHQVLVEDLKQLIAEREGADSWRARALRFLRVGVRRDTADGTHTFGLTMGEYYAYADLVAYMRRVADALGPDRCQLVSLGQSHERRDLFGLQFGRPRDPRRKLTWVDSGIHAREWTAVHTGTYLVYVVANALLGADQPVHQKVRAYLDHNDLLVIPCMNPDGYEFTRTRPDLVEARMWRKNRSPEVCGQTRSGERRCCRGVDLNRNFDFHFSSNGASNSPCSEIYHGHEAFSEPETSFGKHRLLAYVSLHAYSQLVIYPYSNDKHYFPEDIDDLKAVAKRAVAAIGQKYGTRYQFGTGPEIIYAYTGGSADWAKETVGIKYTYTIELRPTYTSWNGFVLEKSQLIPTARECIDGLTVMLDAVDKQAPVGTINSGNSRVDFVAAGQPTVQPPTTTSTASSGPCVDRAPSCASWLRSSPTICRDARNGMLRECRLTCGLCSVP